MLIRWICLPLAAYLIAYFMFIKLIPDATTARNLAIGLIIVGAGPTGTTSNALTMIAGGDLAMSVTVTGLNTLLTPFVLPLVTLLLVGSMAHMDVGAVVIDLLKIVVLPVTLGSVLGSIFQHPINRIKPALAPMAVIALGFIMMGTMSKGAATLIRQFYILPYLAMGVILFVVLGYAIGWFIPKHLGFNVSQRKAACFEIGTTNAAVTLVLALRHFDPLAVVVSIFYGKIMVIVGATLIVPLLQRIRGDDVAAPSFSGNTVIGEKETSV
jgi:BASS family bile acid:Na+ symporter